jgi:hypothetical protein
VINSRMNECALMGEMRISAMILSEHTVISKQRICLYSVYIRLRSSDTVILKNCPSVDLSMQLYFSVQCTDNCEARAVMESCWCLTYFLLVKMTVNICVCSI